MVIDRVIFFYPKHILRPTSSARANLKHRGIRVKIGPQKMIPNISKWRHRFRIHPIQVRKYYQMKKAF